MSIVIVMLIIIVYHKKCFINFLEEKNIFGRDYGHVKGMENYLRITIGTKEQMKKVLDVIKDFVLLK